MKHIADRMKSLRKGGLISQKDLAAKLGISHSAVNRYENNQSEAGYAVLLGYADFFDVSLDYILCRTDKPEGKLYDFKPKLDNNEDVKLFIEMCFDPKSPMSGKLKDTLLQMMGSEEK
jgi:transcriptional regulator with XRE-family HTH domain